MSIHVARMELVGFKKFGIGNLLRQQLKCCCCWCRIPLRLQCYHQTRTLMCHFQYPRLNWNLRLLFQYWTIYPMTSLLFLCCLLIRPRFPRLWPCLRPMNLTFWQARNWILMNWVIPPSSGPKNKNWEASLKSRDGRKGGGWRKQITTWITLDIWAPVFRIIMILRKKRSE